MKGLSSLIATILLLLIIVIVIAVAFNFFLHAAEQPEKKGMQDLSVQQHRVNTAFRVETVIGNQVIIRNTGSMDISNMAFFVNDNLVSYSGPSQLAPNEIGIFFLSNEELAGIDSPIKLRVTSLGWVTEMSVSTLYNQTNDADNLSPIISVANSPEDPVKGELVSISCSATDEHLKLIKIYLDGDMMQCGEAPCILSTSNLTHGIHSYYATAEDENGNTGRDPASGSKEFIVASTNVAINFPMPGATVSSFVTVNATLTGNFFDARLLVDEKETGSEVTNSPYIFRWDSTSVDGGMHKLRVIAKNYNGSLEYSLPKSIVVPEKNTYNFNEQTEITTATWQPFETVYSDPSMSCGEADCYAGALPKGWPSNTYDSDVVANFSASSHMPETATFHSGSEVLDWAEQKGQGIDMLDRNLREWIRGERSMNITLYVSNFVKTYANRTAFKGIDFGDEPYGWGMQQQQWDGIVARSRQAFDLFRQFDTNRTHRYYFNTVRSPPVLRHCREARPDLMLSSGMVSLRSAGVPPNGTLFRENYHGLIEYFDNDYLCTENWGIPFGYTLNTNNWQGMMNAQESRMITYELLAHGGTFINWFVYSSAYGIIWGNINESDYMTFWSPNDERGDLWKNPANVTVSIDNKTAHSGNHSILINFTNVTSTGLSNKLYVDGALGSDLYLYNYNVTNYTLSYWMKSTCQNCTAYIDLGGQDIWRAPSCPRAASYPIGIHDWMYFKCNISTQGPPPYYVIDTTQSYRLFIRATAPGPGTGSVWFDDISVYDENNHYEVMSVYNPGFELKYGSDRSPTPIYYTLQQMNFEMRNLSELVHLKRIEAFDNSHIPSKSLIKSISSVMENNRDNPAVEYGLFVSAQKNGKIYVILVNKVIVDNATVTLKIKSNFTIDAVNVLNNRSLGLFPASNGIVTIPVYLREGDGIVLRLDGISYTRETTGNVIYSQTFDSGLADFIADSAYSIKNVNGNNVLLANTSGGQAYIRLNGYNFSDFSFTGKFKILKFNPASPAFDVVSRRSSSNMYPGCVLQISPDPAIYSNGYIAFVCTYHNWSEYAGQSDKRFLNDTNWHTFKVDAFGSKFEIYIDNQKYMSSSQSDYIQGGFIGIATYSGNEIYFDDITVKELKSA